MRKITTFWIHDDVHYACADDGTAWYRCLIGRWSKESEAWIETYGEWTRLEGLDLEGVPNLPDN